jgi:ketopantoate reductase
MSNTGKKTVLVVGGGSVGAIAALNLEVGGLAAVTVVLRSNYDAVQARGYNIESCDHGVLKSFRPSVGMQPDFQVI